MFFHHLLRIHNELATGSIEILRAKRLNKHLLIEP